jgi:hypothetical protein
MYSLNSRLVTHEEWVLNEGLGSEDKIRYSFSQAGAGIA